MAGMGHKKETEALVRAASEAYANAYAPYSDFRVGAAVLDEKGRIHVGCNVENAAYPSGSCAEEQAIGAMIAAGGRHIRRIVIVGHSDDAITPCGACRQRIREFALPDTPVSAWDIEAGHRRDFTLDELLPFAFGPDHLPTTQKEKA
jgi:cytidine deaminase